MNHETDGETRIVERQSCLSIGKQTPTMSQPMSEQKEVRSEVKEGKKKDEEGKIERSRISTEDEEAREQSETISSISDQSWELEMESRPH